MFMSSPYTLKGGFRSSNLPISFPASSDFLRNPDGLQLAVVKGVTRAVEHCGMALSFFI
jgi:hypothetical protein